MNKQKTNNPPLNFLPKIREEGYKQKAFTLVELIVVITILAILGTIAFISLQGYSANSRDSVRINDVSSIKTALELFHLDSGKYPLPDNYATAQYLGDNMFYQGTFGETVQKNVSRNINKIPTDPLTEQEYVYSVSGNKNELEILSLMEGDDFTLNTISEINAAGVTVIPRITGNYNGLFVKTITHIVPLPSIINTEALSGTLLSLDSNTIKSMITNKGKNVPNQGNVVSATGQLTNFTLTGALNNLTKDSSATQKAAVINTIKSAYASETQLNTDGVIEYITNLATDETTLASFFDTVVLNNATVTTTLQQEETPVITTWQQQDSSCGVATDVTITGTDLSGNPITQVWAPCNSTLGTGIEYSVDQNCYNYVGGTTTGCNRVSTEKENVYNPTYGVNNIWGKLYTWSNAPSACPAGWHLPSQTEWTILLKNLGCADYGTADSTGWLCDGLGWANHTSRTDTNNLENALKIPLAGYRNTDGSTFYNRGNYTLFWSSSEFDASSARGVGLHRGNSAVNRGYRSKLGGFSVRCIKD